MPRIRIINVLSAMKQWAVEHMPELVHHAEPRTTEPKPKAPKVPKVWTDATDEEKLAIAALKSVTFP